MSSIGSVDMELQDKFRLLTRGERIEQTVDGDCVSRIGFERIAEEEEKNELIFLLSVVVVVVVVVVAAGEQIKERERESRLILPADDDR